MKAKRLKEILENVDDDTDIYIRNSMNIFGSIQGLEQVEDTNIDYVSRKEKILILNTESSKSLELNDKEEVIDYIKNDKIKL